VKINHDIVFQTAVAGGWALYCRTHNETLLASTGLRDVPLATVMAAIADHRGAARTVGAARLARNDDGTYRFDMDGVDLSAAVVNDSEFVVTRSLDLTDTLVTLTVAVDSIDFDRHDVRSERAWRTPSEAAQWRYRTHPVGPHIRTL
jgi:hypothetical protein